VICDLKKIRCKSSYERASRLCMVTDDESEDKEIDEVTDDVNQEQSEQDEVDGTKKKK